MTAGSAAGDAEQARIERAEQVLPAVTTRYDDVVAGPDAVQRLWRCAVADAQAGHLDDRPLYWARLKLLRRLRQRGAEDLAEVERQCRGFDFAVAPDEPTVLITGFDPFRLDEDVSQSNPSGAAALALDGTVVEGAVVRAAILPVRFADFDAGIVEDLLSAPFLNHLNRPRLVLTASMGRDRFDLERFPGLRRSSEAPDNRRARTGASAENPLVPPDLAGTGAPEFLEFSLPAAALAAVPGRWPVRDHRMVRTLARGIVAAGALAELANDTAVCGSGGGYLSNEVAYRSLLLGRRLGLRFPIGHLHTPAVTGHDPTAEKDIVDQIRRLVAAALC